MPYLYYSMVINKRLKHGYKNTESHRNMLLMTERKKLRVSMESFKMCPIQKIHIY